MASSKTLWWGDAAAATAIWGLLTGSVASFIGAMHDEAGFKTLLSRCGYALATVACVTSVIALLGYASETLDLQKFGFSVVLLSGIPMVLMWFAPALAGAGRMKPVAAGLSSLRMFGTCLGWGLYVIPLLIIGVAAVAVKLTVPKEMVDSVVRIEGAALAGAMAVLVSARVWLVLQAKGQREAQAQRARSRA